MMGQLLCFYLLNLCIYYRREDLAVVAVMIYMIALGCGMGCAAYAYIPEILPPTGVGLVMMLNWACMTGVSKLTPYLIDKYGLNWTINIFLGKNLPLLMEPYPQAAAFSQSS